jgi:hypothetical protein
MAVEVIKDFMVGLGFEVDQAGLSNFSEKIKNAGSLVTGLAAGITAAAGAITGWVSNTAAQYDGLGDLSERIDVSVEDMKRFQYVALLSGSSVEAATAALQNFSVAVGQTSQGIGRSKEIFESLGISVVDAAGKVKPVLEVLDEVKFKLKDLDKSAQIALLERLGLDQTLMNALLSDVSELEAEFNNLTESIDFGQAVKNSAEFNDALDRNQMQIAFLTDAMKLKLLPTITNFLKGFIETVGKVGPKVQKILDPVLGGVFAIFEGVYGAITGLFYGLEIVFSPIIAAFKSLDEKSGGAVSKVLALSAAVLVLFKSFGLLSAVLARFGITMGVISAPIAGVIALIAGLGLVLEDLYSYNIGGEHLLPWDKIANFIEQTKKAFSDFVDVAIKPAWEWLKKVVDVFYNFLEATYKFTRGDFSGAFESMKKSASSFLDVLSPIKTGIEGVAGAIDKTTRKAADAVKSSGKALLTAGGNELKQFANNQLLVSSYDRKPLIGQSSSKNATINQKTEINISGGAGADAIAKNVAAKQASVNNNIVDNMKRNIN